MTQKNTITKIENLLTTPGKSILTTHCMSDPDSVASCLALAIVLMNKGHDVDIYSQDTIPSGMNFLPGAKEIKIQSMNTISWKKYDYFWSLDIADKDRNGMKEPYPKNLKIINIDHHVTNTNYGYINYVEAESISTCSILFEIFRTLKIKITDEIALCLATGILGDSGFFQFIKNEKPLVDITNLMKQGLDYQKIRFNTLQQNSPEDLKFLGEALQYMKIYPEEKVIIFAIPNSVWKKHYPDGGQEPMITQYLASAKGTNFGAVIIQDKNDSLKVSLRSRRTTFDVAKIATKLGGGGHKLAAGARVYVKTMEEVTKIILDSA